jgi:hypothetical protein
VLRAQFFSGRTVIADNVRVLSFLCYARCNNNNNNNNNNITTTTTTNVSVFNFGYFLA